MLIHLSSGTATWEESGGGRVVAIHECNKNVLCKVRILVFSKIYDKDRSLVH